MIFTETVLTGVFVISLEPVTDERGFFSRSWCQKEFMKYGLNPKNVQCNIAFNEKKGTLRGMHYQVKPSEEAKLVRCTRGAIYDVVIDLRKKSTSYKKWIARELTEWNREALFIPEGLAHGYLTLTDNAELFYQMSEFYKPETSRGIRWNDPSFQITWPGNISVISEKDNSYPDFKDE
ncbi:MAG: dTDP-4-dehydrorhamnose 3,5-epimerase [Methanomicrobiales archaeon]|nr:dTDP-4-dehydrorhamnose 3,5-epimerase [Methanomicrobiales archaeon]